MNELIKDRAYVEEVFREAYDIGLRAAARGRVATYIPELAKADPNAFGMYLLAPDGYSLSYGESDTRFSIQSICKVVILAASLKHFGFKETFSHVMMEPSGDSFNSILKLDLADDRPYNPMINAGAIEIASLLVNEVGYDELLDETRALCMDKDIALDESVFRSEFETGDRNRAIAYLLKSKGMLMGDPDKTLDLYFRMCSLSVNAKSLAGLGLVIANDGVDPFTLERLIDEEDVRTLKIIMFTCGMYDYSGKFGMNAGVPGKSGVGGGVVCAARGPLGLGFYGPALDAFGNSSAAVKAMVHISSKLKLHVFDY